MIEDVDMLVWMLRLPVLVVESQKAESVVSAGERNQSRSTTAVKNNVPSGSQSDVLPFTSTQSELEDRTYSQRIHIDDENKMLHSTRLDPHLRVASSIL